MWKKMKLGDPEDLRVEPWLNKSKLKVWIVQSIDRKGRIE